MGAFFMDKSLHTKNLLANLYIKFGLLLIIALIVLIAFGILSNTKIDRESSTWDTWINGVYMGRHTVTTSANEAGIVVAVAFAIGIIAGLVSLIFRRQIVNFEECYVPLREGTHRRKYIFYLALFLGWSGIDRLLMKRWFLGLIKFLFAFWTINMLIAALTAMPSMAAALGQAFLFSLPFVLYWWTVDVLLIGMGAARERHKSYLR